MKKLIDKKDWNWLCCFMCLILTAFNVVMTMGTNEKCTHATITMQEHMRELIRINRLQERKFNADDPDSKALYRELETLESQPTSWRYKKAK